MAPTMEVKKRGLSTNSNGSPTKRRKLSEINSDANSSAYTSITSPLRQLSVSNNTSSKIPADIQIAKVESINEELFKKSCTNDEDCFIIDNSPTPIINLEEKRAMCRVCLTEFSTQMFPLTSFLDCEDRKILISECLNVIMKKPISFVAGLPDSICMDCIQRVINAYLLVGQFEKNEYNLLKINSKNINTSEMTATAKTPKMELVSKSPTNSKSPKEEVPKTSVGSSNSISDNNTPRGNANSTLERPSRVLCQDCNIQMNVADIGKHLASCKANHMAANLENGKCKVLVCKVCNTLVFFKNMKSHSQVCKSETPLNTSKEQGNSTNTCTKISPQKPAQNLESNESILKDKVNDNRRIIVASTSQKVVKPQILPIRVRIQGVVVPARAESKTTVSNERRNLPVIQPCKSAMQDLLASVLKKRDPSSSTKLLMNPEKRIINTTTNGSGVIKTADAPKIADVSTTFKPASGGLGLHPLENEIRKQLTKQYMFTCSTCFTSFTSTDALSAHKVEAHSISKVTVKEVIKRKNPLMRCSICKKGFINKISLMSHVKSQHTYEAKEMPSK